MGGNFGQCPRMVGFDRFYMVCYHIITIKKVGVYEVCLQWCKIQT